MHHIRSKPTGLGRETDCYISFLNIESQKASTSILYCLQNSTLILSRPKLLLKSNYIPLSSDYSYEITNSKIFFRNTLSDGS